VGQHQKDIDKTYTRTGRIVEGTSLDDLATALEQLVALYDEALSAPRPVYGRVGEQLLVSPEAALAAFNTAQFTPLQPFSSEARLFGPQPDFEAMFGDPAIVDFLTRFLPMRAAPVVVENKRAKSAPRAKSK
jgi:hypothetical protein